MKKALIKKAAAAVMALALVGGALPTGSTSLFGSPSIVKADTLTPDTAILDEEAGVLTLRGNVSKADVRQYGNYEMWDKFNKVVCEEGTVFPADCSNMFSMFRAETFDLSNADTSNVTDMKYMFDCCRKVVSLDLSSFNTSKVTDMSGMFYDTDSLVSLNLSNWDTSNVNDMSKMFYDAQKLKALDLKHFNTSNVRTMEFMFADCNVMESLDISNFDTSNVTTMKEMFINCQNLTSLDVSSFNTSKVENMYWMFGNCGKLASIDVTNFDTSNADPNNDPYALTSTYSMFNNCNALEADIVHYYGEGVTLDGRIEVVFHILEKGYLGNDSAQNLAKIVMSGPNGDITITDFDSVNAGNGKMECIYPLDATQANEKVSLKAYDENGKQLIMCKYYGSSYYYSLCSHSQVESSVMDYMTAIKGTSKYEQSFTLPALVSAIENYCKAAENYFKGAENAISEYSAENSGTVETFAPEFGNDVKLSLVLNSATAVRIYTNASDVKIDGKDITPKTTKYGKCYEISDIPANKLMELHTLTIGETNYKFSPMSYVYRTVNSEAASKLLKDTAWAAYLYAKAAKASIK